MSNERSSRIPALDGLRWLATNRLLTWCRKLEQTLLTYQPVQEQPPNERALILPFERFSPSTRPERLLRLNALPVWEPREERPTETFLPALQRLEADNRHATLSDALGRVGYYVKSLKR